MANTRTFNIPAVFGSTAQTNIPTSPITGQSYRDTSVSSAALSRGFQFDTIATSSYDNQVMHIAYQMLQHIDRQGLAGWTNLVDYTTAGAVVLGSDGTLYSLTAASGPNQVDGVRDPTDAANRPSHWRPLSDALGVGTGTVDLGLLRDTNTNTIVAPGQDAVLTAATDTFAGLLTAANSVKLDNIAAGAEVNVQADWSEVDPQADSFIRNKPTLEGVTNLSLTQALSSFVVESSSGNDVTVPAASPGGPGVGLAGAMTGLDKEKLDSVEAGAEPNRTDEEIQDLVGTMATGGSNTNITVTYDDNGALAGTLGFAIDGQIPIANGGTAATTPAAARTNLGLETVSQAEAEAAVSTTTRAWTAQRVGQAIGAARPTSWTTAARPVSPVRVVGLAGYNTDLGLREQWDGSAWVPVASGGGAFNDAWFLSN